MMTNPHGFCPQHIETALGGECPECEIRALRHQVARLEDQLVEMDMERSKFQNSTEALVTCLKSATERENRYRSALMGIVTFYPPGEKAGFISRNALK